jgi:hypothetical protein
MLLLFSLTICGNLLTFCELSARLRRQMQTSVILHVTTAMTAAKDVWTDGNFVDA